MRALDEGKVEVSLQGNAILLGSEMEGLTTFWSVMRPTGTAYGQGDSVQTSTNEGMAQLHSIGVGRLTDPGITNMENNNAK